jgi:hypothetical protein
MTSVYIIVLIVILSISVVESVVKCVDDGVCMTCNKDELVSRYYTNIK